MMDFSFNDGLYGMKHRMKTYGNKNIYVKQAAK